MALLLPNLAGVEAINDLAAKSPSSHGVAVAGVPFVELFLDSGLSRNDDSSPRAGSEGGICGVDCTAPGGELCNCPCIDLANHPLSLLAFLPHPRDEDPGAEGAAAVVGTRLAYTGLTGRGVSSGSLSMLLAIPPARWCSSCAIAKAMPILTAKLSDFRAFLKGSRRGKSEGGSSASSDGRVSWRIVRIIRCPKESSVSSSARERLGEESDVVSLAA